MLSPFAVETAARREQAEPEVVARQESRRRRNKSDTVVAASLAVIAGYVLYDTLDYPASVSPGAPGPAAFPRLLAFVLLILCGVLIVKARRRERQPAPRLTKASLKRNTAALGVMAAFALVAERTDFFLAVAGLVASLMILLNERPSRIVIVAVLFAVFLYVVFYRLFGVVLPTVF